MRWIQRAFTVGALLPLITIPAIPAHAGGGDVAAGVIGGLAAGTLLGAAISGPRDYDYAYAPPPAYVEPEPYDEPDCYWASSRPYWDDWRGAWVSRRIRVCN